MSKSIFGKNELYQNDQLGKAHLVKFSDFKNRHERAIYAAIIKMSKSREGLFRGNFMISLCHLIDLGNFMISLCQSMLTYVSKNYTSC